MRPRDQLERLSEVVKRYGVSFGAALNAAHRGELRAKLFDRRYFVKASEVSRWLSAVRSRRRSA